MYPCGTTNVSFCKPNGILDHGHLVLVYVIDVPGMTPLTCRCETLSSRVVAWLIMLDLLEMHVSIFDRLDKVFFVTFNLIENMYLIDKIITSDD